MEPFRIVYRERLSSDRSALRPFGVQAGREALAFHESFPEYCQTPLARLDSLARRMGVGGLYVKDESARFGLNSFKALGGSHAIGRYIGKRLGIPREELTFRKLVSPEVRAALGDVTFVTATDGNHGRGVAWTANRLGQRSVVYMPAGSAPERLRNIRTLGADASITDFNYDDAVRFARQKARENGWVVIQDTSWPGYEEIPRWIMQGYATMAAEMTRQMGDVRPTHVFLQAGVGAMAGAVAGYLADRYSDDPPTVVVVEPTRADCLRRTAQAGDGRPRFVRGGMNTIMAGLACGEPCPLGWRALDACARAFAAVPDYVAALGMRLLGNPCGADPRIVSGESGAVTVGFAAELMRREEMAGFRRRIGLNGESRILCISTEGDTDQENYRRIVWDGLYPCPEQFPGIETDAACASVR